MSGGPCVQGGTRPRDRQQSARTGGARRAEDARRPSVRPAPSLSPCTGLRSRYRTHTSDEAVLSPQLFTACTRM